jgi:hypothetical protein
MKVYQSLEPSAGESKILKTLVIIFPGIMQQHAHSLIEEVKDAMKPSFVKAGLMLGDFYPKSKSPGLHNPKFHPLTSPFPLFVYRQLVPDDLVFLTKNSDPPERRIGFIVDYLRCLGDKLSAEWLRAAHAALEAAQVELSERRMSNFQDVT